MDIVWTGPAIVAGSALLAVAAVGLLVMADCIAEKRRSVPAAPLIIDGRLAPEPEHVDAYGQVWAASYPVAPPTTEVPVVRRRSTRLWGWAR